MAKKTQQFKVIIEQDEDGYFVGSIPALFGCHTQAKTLPELKRRLQEAASLCLEVARLDPQYRQLLKDFAYNPVFIGLELVEV